MRHLLLSYHTCPLEEPGTGLSGGMNVYLRELLPGLARCGVATDVLTRGERDAVRTTRPFPGVRIVHVPCGWARPPDRATAYDALPRFVAAARRLLRRLGGPYEVVSAHYWMSGLAARAIAGERSGPGAATPLVFAYHTIEALKVGRKDEAQAGLAAARSEAERRLSREADAIVCLSEEDLAKTREVFPDAAGKGIVIPPGVSEAFRRPPDRRESRLRLGVPPEAFLFLLAARPDPGKNVEGAVAALRELRAEGGPETLLLVAGQGPPAGEVPAGTLWAGSVPHAEMPSLYAASDAALCPSLYESFGLVPLEAMAAGVPVIAPSTSSWGMKIRAGGGGLAYDPGNARELPAAMREIRRGPAFRAALASAGRRQAGGFTWERCAASWARLLSSVSTPGSRR